MQKKIILQVMQTILRTNPQTIKDRFFILGLLFITTLLYWFFFAVPLTSVIGDAERYHGYYMYIIRYSLTHFGQFGLWDQFLSSGMSWISNPGGLLFFPTTWIIILIFEDLLFGAKMLFFIHALTAAVSMYFLLRVLKLTKLTSFLIAIASVSNQYIILFTQNGWFEEFFGMTIIPLSVGLFWLTLTRKSYQYAILGAVAMSFHFLGSTFYVFHYNVIILLAMCMLLTIHMLWTNKKETFLVRLNNIRSYVFLNLVFWAGFIGISAIKLLPIFEFRSISSRIFLPLSVIEHPSNVMTIDVLYSRLRNFFIDPSSVNWFTHLGNDIGAIFIIVCIVYFFYKRSFAYGTFLTLLLLGIWGYLANRIPLDLYAFFYYFLPGFDSNKYPYRFIIVIHFAFLVCIALGLDVLMRQTSKQFVRYFGYILGILLIASITLYTKVTYNILQFPQKSDIRAEVKKLEDIVIKKGGTVYDSPIIENVFHGNLVALLAKIMDMYKPEGRVRSTFYETLDDENISHERVQLAELASVQHFYDQIVPTYQFGIFPIGDTHDSFLYTKNRYKIFSILNARFQLQSADYFEFSGCPKLQLPAMNKVPEKEVCEFLQSRLDLIHGQKNGGIYYDKAVLPRVAVIPAAVLLITDNRFNDYSGFIAKKIMFHPDFDERRMSILSGASPYLDDYDLETLRQFKAILLVDAKVRDKKKAEEVIRQFKDVSGYVVSIQSAWREYEGLHQRSSSIWTDKPAWSYSKVDSEKLSVIFKRLGRESFVGDIEINKFTPEDLLFTVTTDRNNIVFQYSDSFYPGWKAMLDGKKTPVYMADGLVKGVVIPAKGVHTVKFYYSPDSLKKGAIITLVTVTILLSAAGISIWRKKEKIKQVFKYVIAFPRKIFNIFDNIKDMYKQKKLLATISATIIPLLVTAFLLYTYRSIFLSTITSAGDLPYYWDTYIKELGIPYLWNPHWPTGLGGNQAIILPLKLYIQLPIALLVNQWHIPWEFVQRAFLLWTFFFLSFFSSYILSKSWIGPFVYASNTWILMVFSGGQIGVALAYSLAPLVLSRFISVIQYPNHSIVAGIFLAIQTMFDVRIAYVTLVAVLLYFLWNLRYSISTVSVRNNFVLVLYVFVIPLGITAFLHAFWIIPLLFTDSNGLDYVLNLKPTEDLVKFFSFANLSNTLGLLHPNWPENIFGKVGFMKAEFLVLPMLAFSSLLFIKISNLQRKSQNLINNGAIEQSSNRTILFFALLGLVGAFLAKGANEPFGQIYLWFFENIPGFAMFRDPTKFYVLIAIAYSILLPFSLRNISAQLSSIMQKTLKRKVSLHILDIAILAIFISFWLATLRPVFFNQIGGLFKEYIVPQEYTELKKFLDKETTFSRTLWIPQRQRFEYFSGLHPTLSGSDLFTITQAKDMVTLLRRKETLDLLQSMSIRYVILPYDSEKEIFLKDRKYSESLYQQIKTGLRTVPSLQERVQFGKVVVFQVPNPKDHFWIQRGIGSTASIEKYEKINDTQYVLSLKDVAEGDVLVFSEQYDPGWLFNNGIHKTWPTPYKKTLNSYMLWESGSYNAKISFRPQKLLVVGWGISAGTVILIVLLFGVFFLKMKHK